MIFRPQTGVLGRSFGDADRHDPVSPQSHAMQSVWTELSNGAAVCLVNLVTWVRYVGNAWYPC